MAGFFNPFEGYGSGGGSGGGGETYRITISKNDDGYCLIQSIDGTETQLEPTISFDASDIEYTDGQTVQEALQILFDRPEGEQYRISITQDDDGYHLVQSIDGVETILEPTIAFNDDNIFVKAEGGGAILLDSDCSATSYSCSIGRKTSESTMQSTETGSLTFGYANTYGSNTGGSISSSGRGGVAGGYAWGGTIKNTGRGSLVMGNTQDGGQIDSSSSGSFSMGHSSGSDSLIRTISSDGNFAFGSVSNGGEIVSSGEGAAAFGTASVSDTALLSAGAGSFAIGEGNIESSGHGSFAFGSCPDSSSQISANSYGSIAGGNCDSGGLIRTSSSGSAAYGYSNGTNSEIEALNIGSVAMGYSVNGAAIHASGLGSVAIGYATDSTMLEATGNGSVALGISTRAQNDGECAIGKFNATDESDLLFVVGCGDEQERKNAFSINENGCVDIPKNASFVLHEENVIAWCNQVIDALQEIKEATGVDINIPNRFEE